MKNYRIAVFSSAPNAGNHCLVFLVSKELTKREMQSAAAENGLSETAFIHLLGNKATLRIFSPLCEMQSCLHATLAACYVMHHEGLNCELHFGDNVVTPRYIGGQLALRVPLLPSEAIEQTAALVLRNHFLDASSLWPVATASQKLRLLIEYADEQSVRAIQVSSFTDIADAFPDIESFFAYAATGLPNTFIGRMFAPQLGISEDPVNGNSCIALASILSVQTDDLGVLMVRQAQQCSVEMTIENNNALVTANCCFAELESRDL
ncbi:PhzF family phenazine biosynthesis protein [Pseudidiomarina aestuarii]|uniref:PhzF family phenazine biosynthesis protein n=1 Tax=Pseudidiomarina aestuarii TaxID=624146 RepID=UPI003A980F10